MKQLYEKLWAKITALLLLTIFAIVLFFSGLGVLYLADQGGYSNPEGFAEDHIAGNAFYSAMNTAADYYTAVLQRQSGDGLSDVSFYAQQFSRENSNFFFTVQDDSGKTVFESPDQDETYQYTRSQENYLSYNWRDVVEDDHVFASEAAYQEYLDSLERQNFNIYDAYLTDISRTPAPASSEDADAVQDTAAATEEVAEEVHAYISYQRFDYQHVTITGYIRSPLTAKDDIYQESYYANLLVENRHALIAIAAVSFAVCLALFVFLLCAAGHKEGIPGIHLNWVDKIPLDLYLVLAVAAGGCIFAIGIELSSWSIAVAVFMAAVLLVFAALLLMSVFMTLATRFKSGAFWKNTIVYRLLCLLSRMWTGLKNGLSYCAKHLHLYWQAGLIFAGISLLEFLIIAGFGNRTIAVFWLAAKLAEAPALVLLAVSLQKLKAGGEALAAGDLSASVDLRHMFGVLKTHGENLNSIAQGMQKAVQQQLKSERFRTDLITNVSHDIKTPLTSIVNYVDLLKKEDVQPEKAKEYIAVLDRQSARLKKLTEDLVEASKASSGTLPVHLEAVDVNVMLSQVSGEYQSRFELCRLEPVVKLSPDDPKISADGKLLWRVFDNLLSNICKYAMPGTRVYFTSEVMGSSVHISFKNISNYPLDITADELMERFVRGDSSRSTEGSGLGLSIAQSLTSLQKGQFDLVVDGDLFKANLTFPLLNA